MHINQQIAELHQKKLEGLMDLLKDQADSQGNTYTPRRQIAKMIGVSQTTLYKYVYDLQALGRIIMSEGKIHVVSTPEKKE